MPRAWPWWRHVLLHFALWGAIALLFAVQLVAFGVAGWSVALRIGAMDWCPWIVLGPLTFWFAQRVQFSRKSWLRPVAIHLVACISVALLIEVIAAAAFELNWVRFPTRPPHPGPGTASPRVMAPPGSTDAPPSLEPPTDGGPRARRVEGAPPPPPHERPFILRAGRARASIPIYWVLVASAHAFVFHRRALERERRALQAEARLVEARLAALQAQLNPHFLFNALNAVVHYVRADPDAAEEMITTLSELLRLVLAHSDRRVLLLEQDLALVDRYLAIQRIRFADRLSVVTEIEPAALSAPVPTLLLQPLVENAVIHGVAPERVPGTVFLRGRVADHRLILQVADTGKGTPRAPAAAHAALTFTEGMGLSNTRARLSALYGDDFHLTITPAREGGVSVKLDLPLFVPTLS